MTVRDDYEPINVYRPQYEDTDGRRTFAGIEKLGALAALVAPDTREVSTDTGRLVVHTGYKLYGRGVCPLQVMADDRVEVRGERLRVTAPPEAWGRGGRVGWLVTCERSDDQ